jgi:hypothetical protein
VQCCCRWRSYTRCSVSCWLDLLRVSFVLLILTNCSETCFVQICLVAVMFNASLFAFSFMFSALRVFLHKLHMFAPLSNNFYNKTRTITYLAIPTSHFSHTPRTYSFLEYQIVYPCIYPSARLLKVTGYGFGTKDFDSRKGHN